MGLPKHIPPYQPYRPNRPGAPPAQAQAFRKVEDNNSKKSMKEQALERKANYKQK
jgi:hypothetical protein